MTQSLRVSYKRGKKGKRFIKNYFGGKPVVNFFPNLRFPLASSIQKRDAICMKKGLLWLTSQYDFCSIIVRLYFIFYGQHGQPSPNGQSIDSVHVILISTLG